MLSGFSRDRRGNVAVIFALVLAPMLMAIGSVVDYSRWSSVNAALQVHVDTAVLSAISNVHDPDGITKAATGLRSRLLLLKHDPVFTEVSLTRDSESNNAVTIVSATVKGSLDTVFMQLFGFKTMDLGATAEAQNSRTAYEVSLIVDVTGSMKGAQITALKAASAAFVRALLPQQSNNDQILLNIVPYTASVNIGRSRAAWLGPLSAPPYGSHGHPDGTALYANDYIWREPGPGDGGAGDGAGKVARVSENDCRGTGVTWNASLRLCHIGNLSTWTRPGPCPGELVQGICYVSDGWAGCVEERGRGAEDVSDAPLSVNGFQPYYWPSWQGVGGTTPSNAFNSYLPNRIDETRHTNANNNNGRGPNLGCPKDEITDWTNDRDYLIGQIAQFEAWHRGGTMGHIGLAWGWRTLSPHWAGMWGTTPAPRAYDPQHVEKIAVFMTDGMNGFYSGHAPSNDGDYTAYGRLLENPGYTRANQQALLDAKMLAVCQSMRRVGIEIFTVGFGLPSGATVTRQLLRDCASSANHFFDANTSNLTSHFERIASAIRARGDRISR